MIWHSTNINSSVILSLWNCSYTVIHFATPRPYGSLGLSFILHTLSLCILCIIFVSVLVSICLAAIEGMLLGFITIFYYRAVCCTCSLNHKWKMLHSSLLMQRHKLREHLLFDVYCLIASISAILIINCMRTTRILNSSPGRSHMDIRPIQLK